MTKRQLEEAAKYCFDISKLFLGSWVFAIVTEADILIKLAYMVGGLIGGASFYILGMKLLGKLDKYASR